MKKHIYMLIKHPLVSGSGVIFIGSFIANILNYIFNLVMGRLLSVTEYGLLISLVALVTLLTLFQSSFVALFAKFAAQYSAKNDSKSLSSLVWVGTKITLFLSMGVAIVLLLLLNPLSKFLHIYNPLLMVVMFSAVIFSILYSLPAGVLQGNLKFIFISLISIFGAFSKVLVGVILVALGFGAMGGGIAVLVAFLAPFTIAIIYVILKYKINTHGSENVHFVNELKKISGPFLLASIAITILQGTDVIFARHFLNSTEAGQYAALSVMGKAIFYITAPIYFVFFPLVTQKKEKMESIFGTMMLASGAIFICSLFFSTIYFLFPNIILSIFFPSPAYSILSQYLGFYSVYVMIFSLCFLLFNYFLSIGKVGVFKINWLVAVVYIISLYFFHKTIMDFIIVLIASSLLLLFLLCIYYRLDKKN